MQCEGSAIINSVYTFFSFHFPFLNNRYAATVMEVSATGIAIKTPSGPIPNVFDKKYARGIWKNQNPNKLMIVGVRVSPAPLNALAITIPIP
jgi:hypothetical protein